MQIQLDSLSTIKIYLHLSQAILLFLSMILTIAALAQSGRSSSSIIWYFVLSWLTIPLLIFQAMVPQWSRAQRFNSPYIFATVDGLGAFLWLTAWAAVAAYVASGKKRDNGGGGNCENFGYGTKAKCELSEANVFFGLAIMAFFVGAFLISARGVMEYRRTGMLPAVAKTPFGKQNEFTVVGNRNETGAWASNMNVHEDDAEAYPQQYEEQGSMGREGRSAYQAPSYEDEYGQMPTANMYREHSDDIGQMHPQDAMSPLDHQGLGLHSMDTAYYGGGEKSSGYGGLGRTGTGR